MLTKYLSVILITLGLSHSGLATDAEPPAKDQTPYQIVEHVTVGILDIIETHRGAFEDDPEPFFRDLERILEPAVDFRFIAKNVMGPYGKEATKEQRSRFEEAFKEDLIQTYARGLMSYGDQEIVLLPVREDLEGKRRLTVRQEIHSKEKTYPLNYSFGLNRDGQWKVTNLVLNGINLGKTFRNQFIQRTEAAGGDIDKVIENWTTKLELPQTSAPNDGTEST